MSTVSIPNPLTGTDFLSRADNVTNLHIRHVRQATIDLNTIMAALKQSAKVTIPQIGDVQPEGDPTEAFFRPETDISQIFKDDYAGEFSRLKEWFVSLREGAASIFFPYMNHSSGGQADEWISRAIAGTAINLAEDAELARGRTRVMEEALRAKRQAANSFATLSYALPPGALIAARQEADFVAGRMLGELNRDLTIKAQEVRIEMVKFAVEQVNSLRQVAANGLTGYMNAFASLPGSATQYAAQKAEAKQALWAAGRDYYTAQLGFKNLLLDVKKANQQGDITMAQLSAGLDDKAITRDLESLHTAAEVYGRLVAGAMSGINSHISLSAGASVSGSHTINEQI